MAAVALRMGIVVPQRITVEVVASPVLGRVQAHPYHIRQLQRQTRSPPMEPVEAAKAAPARVLPLGIVAGETPIML